MRILSVLLLSVLLSVVSCATNQINGQVNKASKNVNTVASPDTGDTDWHKNMPGNAIQPAPVATQQSNRTLDKQTKILTAPYIGIIKIKNPPAYDSSDQDAIKKWKEILRWGDFCYEDRIAVLELHELNGRYALIEIVCKNGAYNFDSLIYYLDKSSNAMTAKLLQFEYFRKEDESPNIVRHVTYVQNGITHFDKTKKEISNYHKFIGGGICGWEANYKILNGKSILKSMKAQWSCEPDSNGDFPEWKTVDLNKLRKRVKKTVYDKFGE